MDLRLLDQRRSANRARRRQAQIELDRVPANCCLSERRAFVLEG